ncbi:efflux RND transporter periplasmic adaptor subunit [Elongatibacter sediminis]|uniref:Efflux RND transporter periplasmic adaptor subunit n=1 Tax=Elongatibacter sediminis TaxID=3119006 RepID=A0AAW9RA77_9GAMM
MMSKTSLSPLARMAVLLCTLAGPALAQPVEPGARVSALGRLEPQNGVLRVAAPLTPLSISGSVVSRLLVAPGDDVEVGQLLAVMETAEIEEALVNEAEAEYRLALRRAESARSRAEETCVQARVAEREAERRAALLEKGVAGEEEAESAAGQAEALAASCAAARTEVHAADAETAVAEARVERRRTELERSHVRAPAAGRILGIMAWPGEMAAQHGVLELGRVNHMFAIAEVYETDIGRVRVGQRAEVRSDALAEPLTGTVESIHGKVEKQDEIGTDPAARKDARIIEVEVRLDDPAAAAGLTYLQVEVVFQP